MGTKLKVDGGRRKFQNFFVAFAQRRELANVIKCFVNHQIRGVDKIKKEGEKV